MNMDTNNQDLMDDDKQFVNDSVETPITIGKPDDKLEITVEDDTPPEDRNRKPLEKDALAEDDEAANYSDKIKKRLGELRHQAHDERRAREAAQRERDEAVRIAQESLRRSKMLEQRLTAGELSYAGEVAAKANLAIEAAKAKHQRAYEAGDGEKMAEAVAEMAEAKQQALNAQRWAQEAEYRSKNALQQQEKDVDSQQQSRQQQFQAPQPDPRAVDWAAKNAWFGTDEAMTSLAYGVHERLVRSGVDPIKDAAKYYSTIDAEMRRRFPEFEWEDAGDDSRAKPSKKPQAVVAPVTRTPTGSKNKVVLTQTQVRMAEKMGLTLEQYARELQKLNQGV